jgi:hypothetical protein
MSFGVFIQPNPVWAFLDQAALPAAGGFIYTYESSDHQTPKATYQNNDLNALVPWSNPITLDATGKQADEATDICYPIFWADDAPYYIEITDSDNNIIFQGDGFPWNGSNEPVISEIDIENYFINAQLYFDNAEVIDTDGDRGFNDLPASELSIAPDNWFFIKNNTSATDTITIVDFSAGQTEVLNNPKAYFIYNCTVPGTSETQKKYYYKFGSVRQFANETINIQFYARSTLSSQLSVTYTQYFGTGGSPSATNTQPITTQSLTGNWVIYQVSVEIDDLTSKNIGTNGDDYLSIDFNMPFNSVANVQLSNMCLRFGDTFIDIQEESVNITSEEIKASSLPLPRSVNWDDGNYELMMISGVQTWVACAGRGCEWYTNAAPSYALLQNGLPYYSSQYYNLANYLYQSSSLSLPFSYGPQGFTVSIATATLTITCVTNGAVTSGSAGTSGFSFTQTSNGSGSTPGIVTLVVNAASTILPGEYFLINSPSTSYFVYFSQNNETKNPQATTPALSGKTAIKVSYTGSETDAQLAALILIQLEIAHFRVPDQRGLTSRMPDFGATAVFPVASQLKIRSLGNDSGVTFAIVGLDVNGAASSENLTGANVGTATSVNTYSAITSVTPNINTASFVAMGDSTLTQGISQFQLGFASVPTPLNGNYGRDPDYYTQSGFWAYYPIYLNQVTPGVTPADDQTGDYIAIVSVGNDSGINFVIRGYTDNGAYAVETIAGTNAGTVPSANLYSIVISITPTGNTASTVTAKFFNHGIADGICLSQSGTTNTALNINGAYAAYPANARTSLYAGGAKGDNVGSLQIDSIRAHEHSFPESGGAGIKGFSSAASDGFSTFSTQPNYGNETRIKNIYVNKIIYF